MFTIDVFREMIEFDQFVRKIAYPAPSAFHFNDTTSR